MLVEQKDKLKVALKEIFGFDKYRGNQEEIIKSIYSGRDTFVIMPTGAGKSLCYQLPAVVLNGTAIIISPLIALMKNQVDQMRAFGIDARFLNSTLSKTEAKKVKADTLEEKVKMLYVAPESLTKEDNVEFLKKANISFVAVDEAHCISEWGHDFRPEYRRIKSIVHELGAHPIIALTATATPKVQLDIMKNLEMDVSREYKSSFNRDNLYYEVRPKLDIKKQLIKFLKAQNGKSGIIYCLSRKKVEEVAELLRVNDINAAPYHAGLESATRMKNQDDFLNEDLDVIVATIAFGMGIDKPDVRFVAHYDVPKSLEGYYQETGRAGRDGILSHCLMFFSHNDILKLDKFNKDKPVQERDNSRLLLQETTSYAESAVCRRKQLLHYFGESYNSENCNNCDNCLHPTETYPGSEYVMTTLEAALLTDERFGMLHLVDVITGKKSDYVTSYKHDQIKVFGAGNEHSEEFWRSVVRQTLLNEFLEKDINNIGILRITEKGKKFLNDPFNITLFKNHDYTNIKREDEEVETVINTAHAYDETLFSMLKTLRKSVAKHKGVPPYVVFQDPSIEEMATTFPCSLEDLQKINGVGQGKAIKFGQEFVDLISDYVEENDIITAFDVTIKSTVDKSKNKVFIITQIDKKLDLDEIADSKGLSMTELLSDIENIVASGTKLNLDYYIDQVLDDERQDDLHDYFLNAETDDLNVALDNEDNDEFSEEDIRLMRIKFLSEYAN